ncbi:MAG: dethiobiotin synthase [Deltaproteobacteria bacterium]
MRGIFIAGTDTGAGKTVVTGCLARYLAESGYSVITQKWIQTGCGSGIPEDIQTHLNIMGRDIKRIEKYFPYVAPYKFKEASSPHLAAQLENKIIDAHKIVRSFKALSCIFDFVLAEGIGGLLVPFSRRHLVIDIAKELDLPVLLVVNNKLGAINHALLTIEALKSRKMKLLGLVFNNPGKENRRILEDNPRIIGELKGGMIFGTLPREKTYRKLYEKFVPVGAKITKRMLAHG